LTANDQSSFVRQVLPRGRHAAPREIVAESQRGRLLLAMASAVAEKGYARTSVADVIERARVSRRSFYEHFSNKEECFLAAYDEGVSWLLESIAEAVAAAGTDVVAVATAGARSYVELLAANPDFARTFLVEIQGAGPAALERRAVIHQRFADQLADSYRMVAGAELPEPPPYVFRAAVGAVNELVTEELVARGPGALPELVAPIMDIQLRLLRPR
jgi:AcrR family transcriptional regulator